MKIYTGTIFNTIQPTKVKHEYLKVPVPLCTHPRDAYLCTLRQKIIPRALFILEQLETTKCHQLQSKSLSMHAMVIHEQ